MSVGEAIKAGRIDPGVRFSILPDHGGTADEKRRSVNREGEGYFLAGDDDALIGEVEVPDRSFRRKGRQGDLLGEHTAIQHHGCLRRG